MNKLLDKETKDYLDKRAEQTFNTIPKVIKEFKEKAQRELTPVETQAIVFGALMGFLNNSNKTK